MCEPFSAVNRDKCRESVLAEDLRPYRRPGFSFCSAHSLQFVSGNYQGRSSPFQSLFSPLRRP
jgi:hypothetical protein